MAFLKRAARLSALAVVTAVLAPGPSPPAVASVPASATWVYLRGGQPPAANARVVSVLAVGDVMLGRGMAGTPAVFSYVTDTLQGADLAIGNLEGAIAFEGTNQGSLSLLMSPDTEEVLAQAGFDLLGLANNHALDAGPAGLSETEGRLCSAGIEPVDGLVPVVRQVGGLKLALLAWNDLGAPDKAPLLRAVREARSQADAVVVMVHWGQEYTRHPVLPQRDLAAELLAAGADAVLGAHPHVAQDLQIVQPGTEGGRTRLVAISLGNFAFDQGWDDTAQGLAVRLLFDEEGLRAAQALPLWTAPRPRWMDPGEASDLLARVLSPERIGFACPADACQQVGVPDDPDGGIFESGSIDLTGDGIPEMVRLRGGAAEILEGTRSVWRSPPEWQVRDVTLGDPNGDGRYELLLAVDGAKGPGTSQPIVLGYRGGMYRQLWGGSPVSDPIREVELADLDGDGEQEVAVVESAAGGSSRDVAVWRWHGWGFGLVWRSLPGAYHDLIVLPSAAGRPARLSVATQ